MARRRRYQPIVRIRRALLVALILFVGAMAGYYFSGRLGSNGDPAEERGQRDRGFTVGEGVLTIAEGFDYEVTDGEELAYRVKAERLVSDIQDRMDLEQMEVELPQDDGGTVLVVANQGSVHLDSKSADLEGAVRARGADGLELAGERFEVVRDGRQLISKAPVTFGRAGEYTGSAKHLNYSVKKERLALEGKVVIHTLPKDAPDAGTLRCQKLYYDRLEGTLRLEGSVEITRGHEYIEADRLSLSFGEDENDLRSIRADGGVEGRYLPEPSSGEIESRLDFRGKVLYAAFEPGTRQARQAELRGRSRQGVVLDMIDVSGLSRVVTASVVSAVFSNGEIATVDADEPVVMAERHAFAPAHLLRRVCAEQLSATFDDLGEMEQLTLTGNVDYQATDMQALGDQIVSRAAAGSVSITGRPATVFNVRGEVQAPAITYAEAGTVTASDGVRAVIARSSGIGLMGSSSAEPVRVTAQTAVWSESPVEQVEFSGRVRAWQGGDYLLAEKLVGEPELDRLTATEKVKTVLKRKASGRMSDESGDAAEQPIEITAKKLIYEQSRRVITYERDARAVQGSRVMECETMDLELDENDELDRLVCTGDLLVEDPDQGKEVRGEVAIYVPGADEVDVTGDPVVLTDIDGTELKGGRIIYRFDTGTAQIGSRPVPEDQSAGRPESPGEID